jgi:hypothetical protein
VSNINFAPTFHHTDWIDNVDKIMADGPTGFNVRLNAIESDLQQLSTVVALIDTTLDEVEATIPVPPAGEQHLTVPLAMAFAVVESTQGVPFVDANGEFHFPQGTTGAAGLIGLSLPEGIQLTSLRVIGRFPLGVQAALTVALNRALVVDITSTPQPLAVLSAAQSVQTNPFDVTIPVDSKFATPIDLNTFRYFISAGHATVPGDPTTMSIAGIQVGYVQV